MDDLNFARVATNGDHTERRPGRPGRRSARDPAARLSRVLVRLEEAHSGPGRRRLSRLGPGPARLQHQRQAAAVRDYSLDQLAADVVGLIDAAGRERAIVVGHDWGGGGRLVGGQQLSRAARRLVIINVPHPLVLRRLLWTSPRQLARSWYMFAMQLPWLHGMGRPAGELARPWPTD